MWNVHKVRVAIGDRQGAAAAARYVLEPSDSPLAFSPGAEEGEEPKPLAYWLGSENALAQLGLRPGQEVEQAHLELAMQGRHIDGAQVRRPGFIHQQVRDGAGKPKRTPDGKLEVERKLGVATYDLTFSAPKSVSVIWSQAPEELRRKIERAMLESWNLATQHLIASHDVVMQGRDGGERKYGPAAGFAASASIHATARRAKGDPAPAPQLHVHGSLVGLERDDGVLAGINSKAIFGDAALEAGAYARALLAERIAEIGFEIESDSGSDGLYFEIAGVPKGLIEVMSPRTAEIEEEAKRLEAELERELSKRERSVLAVFTRLDKEEASPREVSGWWRALAEEFEFGERVLADLIGEPGYRVDPKSARVSLAAAVEKCMRKRGPTVTRAGARAIVMAAAPGRLGVAEAEEMIKELQDRGALLALEEGRVTVPSIRTEELEVVATLRRIAERPHEALGAEAIAAGERYANEKLGEHELDPEQRQAIAELSEGAGWSILTGRAGTGKTPVLQALAEAHRQEGWDVVGCAIDWATAEQLAENIGSKELSLRQLIIKANEGKIEVGKRTLILIEEAGKIGLEQWHQLAKLVEEKGARVLLVGHVGQIGAVELAGMFEEMVLHSKGVVPVSELREIRRQKHKWMRELQIAIDDGEAELAVEILERIDDEKKESAITFYPTGAEAREGLVERWFEAKGRWGGEEAMMIVEGSNEDVDEVNALAQARRLREGKEEGIGGPSAVAPGRGYSFYAGDQVVLRGAAYYFEPGADGARERQVENGTRGIVREVDPAKKRISVEVKEPGAEPRRVEIDLARPPRKRKEGAEKGFGEPSWRLAYASHPNPAQGLTKKAIDNLSGHRSQNQESTYVELSRQEEELHVHLNCEGFEGETKEEWKEEFVRMIKTSRRREASIRYAEAPDWKIADAPAAGYTLPEGIDLDARTPRAKGHSLEERFDPLAAHRSALGRERAAWIERHAERFATIVAKMDTTRLRAERAKAREAFASLNPDGARRTLALQRERAAVEAEAQRAEHHAESLVEQASKLRRRDQREEREARLEFAATQFRLAAEDREQGEALADEERELHRDGVHLDDWMRGERDAAGRYLALERELFARRRQSMEEEIEAALREPPPDIVELIGPAPEVEDPAREEWEEVVIELETNRMIAEGELPAAEPSPRQRRELERRVEDLREWRNAELGPEAEVAPEPSVEVE